MNYINNLLQKTFKRRLGKNIGTLIAIGLGVSLMVGVQITITSFTSTAIDPEEEKLYYIWNWGDSSGEEKVGPYLSGEECHIKHSWNNEGAYNVKVKAIDEYNQESVWSEELTIKISKSRGTYKLFFTNILKSIIEKISLIWNEKYLTFHFNNLNFF